MNNVFLGAVDVAVSPDQAQTTNYWETTDQPNPDGSYSISLPPNAQSGGPTVAFQTDEPQGDTGTDEPQGDPGTDEPGTDEPGATNNMKKMLPVLIIGGLALMWFLKKRKK